LLKFEEYLTDFTNTINIWDFVINMIVATLLSLLLKYFYIRFAQSFSNREKFAAVFVPMALGTLLIITVVQSSIALSLGLVGALSIVRFRAAIKEPEELTYLFLVIGIGLTCGANKPLLAIIALVIILPLIYLNTRIGSRSQVINNGKMFINIRSKTLDIDAVSKILTEKLDFVELKRMDSNSEGYYMSFLADAKSSDALADIQNQLRTADPELELSIIDQPDLVL